MVIHACRRAGNAISRVIAFDSTVSFAFPKVDFEAGPALD